MTPEWTGPVAPALIALKTFRRIPIKELSSGLTFLSFVVLKNTLRQSPATKAISAQALSLWESIMLAEMQRAATGAHSSSSSRLLATTMNLLLNAVSRG